LLGISNHDIIPCCLSVACECPNTKFEEIQDLPIERSLGEGWLSATATGQWQLAPAGAAGVAAGTMSSMSAALLTSSSAGGCFPNFPSWRSNPQFRIALPTSSASIVRSQAAQPSSSFKTLPNGDVAVRILIMLQRTFGDESEVANGFYVLSNPGPATDKLTVSDVDILLRSEFVQSQVVTAECWLPALTLSNPSGAAVPNYVIMPSTFQPGICGPFTLRAFAPVPLELNLLNEQRWSRIACPGEWTQATAGGCRNYQTWAENPQQVLTFDPSKGNEASCLVTLVQHQPTPETPLLPIGFYIINKNGETAGKGAFMHAVEISCQLKLSAALQPYLVVPCTFEPQRLGKFTVTAFSSIPVELVDVAENS
jgi:hypothetical protein